MAGAGPVDQGLEGDANPHGRLDVPEQAARHPEAHAQAVELECELGSVQVRAELAVAYLRDARLKLLEIAMLLGYSNISSFTTAFKSWYYLPPAKYRQKFLDVPQATA